MLAQLLLGFILSLGVATVAWRLHALTPDGIAAATVVGGLIFGFGGWRWAVLLVLFFATSSLLTRWQAAKKTDPEHLRGRSSIQVLANGSVATVLAVWWGITSPPHIAAAFAGAIAASTADTWATEIGLLSPQPPRLITTWQIVPLGQSGGVTWLGTLGGITGAALVAIAGTLLTATDFLDVWLAGSLAMLIDSVLGAAVEDRVRGIDNNAVNLITTAAGAALAIGFGKL